MLLFRDGLPEVRSPVAGRETLVWPPRLQLRQNLGSRNAPCSLPALFDTGKLPDAVDKPHTLVAPRRTGCGTRQLAEPSTLLLVGLRTLTLLFLHLAQPFTL